jgi:hypothetical protein
VSVSRPPAPQNDAAHRERAATGGRSAMEQYGKSWDMLEASVDFASGRP